MIPIIQKIQLSAKCFIERRLPKSSGSIFVEEGTKVRPFDFVAEVKSNHKKRLTAGVSGEVVKILPKKAVLIKSSGVRVRGVFGQGKDSEGEIVVLTKADGCLKLSMIDEKVSGKILVCGSLTSLEVAKKTEALSANGVVCGGANSEVVSKTNLAILLTEGFGKIPLTRRIFEFLKKVEGRHVFLSPDHKELLVTKRFGDRDIEAEEIFDHLPNGTSEAFVDPKVGQRIQVFTARHFGKIGKIKSLPQTPAQLESGVVTRVVEVELDEGGTILVPERNLGAIK